MFFILQNSTLSFFYNLSIPFMISVTTATQD